MIICAYLGTKGYSQELNLGFPPVKNYNKEEYKSGSQNWDVLSFQHQVYFANDGGLMSFNGLEWQIHPTPNNTILRSIAASDSDTIYIGAQGELGYFVPNSNGQLTYTSLLDQLPESVSVNEVWDLIYHKGTLYARTKINQILKYNKGVINTFGNKHPISNIALVNDEIWYHVAKEGIYRHDGHTTNLIENSEVLKDLEVVDILETSNNVFFLTEHNGIYTLNADKISKWDYNAEAYLKDKKISCGIVYKDEIIVGTKIGGALKIGPTGQTSLLLNKKNGLQNNSVTGLAISPSGSLWISSSNGISEINFNAKNEIFFPDGNLEGAVYDIEMWQDKILFCTSHGVYYLALQTYYNPLKSKEFKLVKGTKGQAWGLDIIDNKLFCSHHDGAFQIKKDMTLKTLLNSTGAWKFTKLDDHNIAIGTYTGVTVINNNKGTWTPSYTVPELNESSRIMVFDKYKNLWVSHPYKKVYKITFNENFNSSMLAEYDKNDGLNTDKRNYVFNFQDECIVTNETGVYKYSSDSNSFILAPKFQKDFPPGNHLKNILKIKDAYWTIAANGTGLINIDDKGISIKHISNSQNDNNFIGGFENFYPLSDSVLLICTDKGVNEFTKSSTTLVDNKTALSSITLPLQHDSLVYAGHGTPKDLHLKTKENSILFHYISEDGSTLYSHKLDGLDEIWSNWAESNRKEYNNLPHGSYTFLVKSMSDTYQVSKEAAFHFTIKTPWHKSILAYLLYGLLVVAGLVSLLLIPRKKYEENKAILESQKKETEEEMMKVKQETEEEVLKLKQEKEREMEDIRIAAEYEMERVKREKLEAEILFKNKELAMSTMNLLQKNETLTAIRSEVEKVIKNIKDPQAKKEARKIINLLRSDDRLEDDWNNFSIHFDQAHHQFLERLKKKYSNLTPKDQKLCAYLRMNLSTKEIAPLLKISVRGVEISRYRLRKKLELDKEINLNSFMMDF